MNIILVEAKNILIVIPISLRAVNESMNVVVYLVI